MRKRFAIGLLAAIIVLSLAVARRDELLRFVIQEGAGLATGYTIQIAQLRVGRDEALLSGLHVERERQTVLDASRIALRYSLRDLLPGSAHRFGLRAIQIDGAKLTLLRFRDGSFNFNIPRAPSGPPVPQPSNPVPLRFSLRVRDAQVELREPAAYDVSAKYLRVDGITADASIDTAALTRYQASGAFEQARREPFTLSGRSDAIAGFAMHRARAPYFPVRALANYFADTAAVRILGGEGRNFDARLYALGVEPGETPQYHVGLRLDVDSGRLALTALAAPVENFRAHLELVDGTFFVQGARAALAGIPLRIDGGVFDITGALTGAAELRLGVSGTGDLSALGKAFSFARNQPISGTANLGVLVQGPVVDPVIVARIDAPNARYRAMPFNALTAGVVYHSNVVALAPVRVYYGGVEVRLNGTLEIGRQLRSLFALHVEGSANNLPYLDEMLGDEPIVVDASATGSDLLFHLIGSAASARGVSRVAALIDTNPNGTASVVPFWFHTERGSFDGGYLLDRPDSTSAFWMLASGLRMHAPRHNAFPGIPLPEMPPINSRTVGMALAGGGAGNAIVMAGNVTAADASIADVKFDRVGASFGGLMRSVAVNSIHALGPWGAFDGHGGFSAQRFVAYGDYRGTFEGLQPFLGSAIVGHGGIAGTVGIGIGPRRIFVQGSNLAMRAATLRGIPISGASLTLGIEGNQLRVYSARANAAGGDVVAAGTFALAPGSAGATPDAVALVAKQLKASQLRGIGLPLETGTLSATGELSAGTPIPTFDGGVAIDGGRMDRFQLTGNGDVRVAGNAVALHRVLGALGSTYTHVDGSIGALTSGAPAYALDAQVPAAQIAPALRSFGFPNYMTDGTFNARLHIAGRSIAPNVSGLVGVPAGQVNGLSFINGSALLAADPHGVAMHAGSVLVGTTATHFTAVVRPHENLIDVRAPHADLSDFNNFFDTGDTLDGDGRVKLAAAAHGARITSSGDIDIRGFRYRNLPIGDTRAVWTSGLDGITGSLAIGGSEGMLRSHGSIALTPTNAWQSTLMRSRFDLAGKIDDLDLALWLPALGMRTLPITGRASGAATVRGRYPNLDVRGDARIVGGTLGPLALDRAGMSLHSAGRRIVIDRAELATSALAATASGTLGMGPNEPIDVQAHAQTDQLAELIYNVSRVKVPVTGSFESTLRVGGTYKAPTFVAGFDASNVVAHGIPIASLFGEMRVSRGALVVSNAGASFTRGEATLAGSLPLQLSPLRLAAPDQPISFDLDVVGLDPGMFDDALGNNTKLTGLVDGHVGLSGTIREPAIVGRISLANGSYVSDLQRVPVSQIAAELAFNHTSATIQHASARFGNGTIVGSGSVAFPNGFASGGAVLALKAMARGAQLDLPAYGNGTLDGAITLTKRANSDALLAGDVMLSDATLSFAAFVSAAQRSGAGSTLALPLAFNMQATAGKNVRVRGKGYGAGLDIGVAGSAKLAGRLAAPTLVGTFTSTGGTLTYFDRAFRVQQGSVAFNAADGVLPTLNAVATTTVVNPDPDRARNPYGSAEVTIRVNGPIAGLRVDLDSNPPGYSKEQILGLIAPFGGFATGIGFTRQGELAQQQPNGIAPIGAVSPIPNVGIAQRSTITVGQEAFNLLNAQFTAGLLSPIESTLGQGLGLSSINLTLGYYGNVGFTASRLLGRAVSAVYAVTFGIPQTQSFGLMVQPSPETTASLNFFLVSGPTKLLQLPNAPTGFGSSYLATEPLIGNTGFSLTLQRHFW
ncbi:MAG: translocation/assembly module TamB domain-containing protein [Candidatus Cybelea sp.]